MSSAYYVFFFLVRKLYIYGAECLQLSAEEVKSMCPLGIAKKIIRLMPQLQEILQVFTIKFGHNSVVHCNIKFL